MAMPTWEEVEAVLDEIRPALRFDGGDVELVDIKEDGTVLVRMIGACSGCGMSVLTLKAGIERDGWEYIDLERKYTFRPAFIICKNWCNSSPA